MFQVGLDSNSGRLFATVLGWLIAVGDSVAVSMTSQNIVFQSLNNSNTAANHAEFAALFFTNVNVQSPVKFRVSAKGLGTTVRILTGKQQLYEFNEINMEFDESKRLLRFTLWSSDGRLSRTFCCTTSADTAEFVHLRPWRHRHCAFLASSLLTDCCRHLGKHRDIVFRFPDSEENNIELLGIENEEVSFSKKLTVPISQCIFYRTDPWLESKVGVTDLVAVPFKEFKAAVALAKNFSLPCCLTWRQACEPLVLSMGLRSNREVSILSSSDLTVKAQLLAIVEDMATMTTDTSQCSAGQLNDWSACVVLSTRRVPLNDDDGDEGAAMGSRPPMIEASDDEDCDILNPEIFRNSQLDLQGRNAQTTSENAIAIFADPLDIQLTADMDELDQLVGRFTEDKEEKTIAEKNAAEEIDEFGGCLTFKKKTSEILREGERLYHDESTQSRSSVIFSPPMDPISWAAAERDE